MHAYKRQRIIQIIGLLALLSMAGSITADTSDSSNLTVYRCVDSRGKVSLQDIPCTSSASQETKTMARPKDAVPAKGDTASTESVITPAEPIEARGASVPAPELYRCTDFDGKVRDAEYYDPKPRCVPLWALGYKSRGNACRWVEDSCVRYQGAALCQRWEDKARQAELDVSHASSSDAPFLKSELARFTQIVQNSCRW